MFYYAEINNDYLVINTYSLTEVSTNANYIAITEEQYTDGDLIDKYYNSLTGNFEIMADGDATAPSDWITYGETSMILTTKIDNMQVEINNLANNNSGGVSQDDLQVLEDMISAKADATHSHTEYATIDSLSELSTTVSGKANVSHNHDDTYYNEAEIDTKLATKSDSSHTHTGVYDPSGSAASALTSANAYTDSKIDALVGEGASITLDTIGEISTAIEDNQDAIDLLNSAIVNKANVTDLNTHASDTELHITDAERNIWNAKSDFSGNYNDLTNKPNIPSINGLASEDYVDEKVGAVTVESIGALPNTTVIPTVPTNVSSFANDAGYLTEHQSLDGLATETYVNTQIDAIDIPNALSDLTADSTHRLVTDAEKAAWNAKSNFSGSYNDLTDKPSIPSISGLATETYVDEAVSTKANSNHTHDNRYYTETEVDTLLSAKANSNHNHNSSYDALGTAETKANEVQANLDAVNEDLTEHIGNSNIHFTAAERTKLSGIATNANNYTHPDSGVTAGTYKSVTVNALGHVTAGTNPTTLAGYGITDAEPKGSTNSALASAKEYTDIAVDTLNETIATKAKASDLTSHTSNTTVHVTSTEKTNWNNAKTHADSAHAPANAEPNQNAFSNVVVGSTTISADTKTDTLTFVAGSNVTITPDATGDSITISSANTVYTHPTTTGNKHIPAGGSSGQILRWSADGTAVWGSDNNTTYSNATQSASGLMSNTDKTKLDGVAENANNYTLPSAGTSLGGVKSGGDVSISSGIITVNDDSHNHVISNIDGLQSALDGKASSGHNHDGVYYTEAETDTLLEGKADTSHTHTISNITNLQSTLDGKANASHGTHVSYSTTAPVMDGTASVGTASTVARSDHKHPTDTSRAAQTSLDSHTSNKSNPHGVTLAQLGLTATAAELNKMDGVTATTAELNYVDGVTSNIQTQLNGKASSSHTHSAATTSAAGLMSASDKAKLDGIASGANAYTLPTASSTLGGVKTTSTVTSNSGYTACPIIGGVPYYKDTNTTYNLGSFGVTATAAELNVLDGITATVTELNYMDGVTSNVQTQLNGKAASSHGTHVTYDTTAPKANGTAAVGTASTVSRSDHVHPLQTTVSGNAGTATKLATARTISLSGDVTGSTSFDGSGNVSITATVADDSHNHTIANVDGLQTALNGKSATSHNHDSAYISKDLQFLGDNGGAIISINRDDGKNVLTEIGNLPIGFYTVYSQSGTDGNPKTTEAWRFMVHKTGAATGWVQGYGSIGSVYTNYQDGVTTGWRGWKCIWDNDPNPLWSGQYYMSSPNSTPQTVTPTKKLSECRTGWLLLWSDYDAGSGSNDSDFVTTIIPKNDPSGNKWGGKSFLCDIPRYVGSNAEDVDTERRIIKPIYVHDDCIKGSYQNDKDERNDVVLRAVYEI